MKKKITIVILIVLIIIGIWFIKNNKKESTVEIRNVNSTFKLDSTVLDLDELKSYNLPIILDFGADGCPACDKMHPYLVELNNEVQEKAIVKCMDVWKYPDLANGYPVELIPTQFLFNSDGTPYNPTNADEMNIEIIKDENGNHTLTKHVGILTLFEMRQMLKEMGMNE